MPLDLEAAAGKLTATLKALAGCSSLDDARVRDLLVHRTKHGKKVKKVMEEVAGTAMGDWLHQKRQTAVTQYAKDYCRPTGRAAWLSPLVHPNGRSGSCPSTF